METVVWLLLAQGALGALDTLWYHEWRQRLPTRPGARLELRLHAARDAAYAVLFGSLAWWTWRGAWAWCLMAILAFEVLITLWDFIEEDRSRPLPAGERVMHAVMAIVYGAFLAHLLPLVWAWSSQPTAFAPADYGWRSWAMSAMAVGVALSGARDLWASAGPRVAPAVG